MILVDTSVWIEHFRRDLHPLRELLLQGVVLGHPFIVGELACGTLKNRRSVLTRMNLLFSAPVASHEEVLGVVERFDLSGKGIGWIDAHLVASSLLMRASLWTFDRRLARVARDMDLLIGLENR